MVRPVKLTERDASLVLSNWWRSIGMAGAGISVWNELGARVMGPLLDRDFGSDGGGPDQIASFIRVVPTRRRRR